MRPSSAAHRIRCSTWSRPLGLWPKWHVLSRAVAGITERPAAKLQAEDGTVVTCIFEGRGGATVFRRVLELGSAPGGREPLPASTDTGTERSSVANLKALVENILWREAKGRELR